MRRQYQSAIGTNKTTRKRERIQRGIAHCKEKEIVICLATRIRYGRQQTIPKLIQIIERRKIAHVGRIAPDAIHDVFAELDARRRAHLAERVADAPQVLITAAVVEDVPPAMSGAWFDVIEGTVTRRD